MSAAKIDRLSALAAAALLIVLAATLPATAAQMFAECNVRDCFFCNEVRLSIEGGPAGTQFYGNGESSTLTIDGESLAGDYSFSCSYIYDGGAEKVPKGCSGSFSLTGEGSHVNIGVTDPCEYSRVDEN